MAGALTGRAHGEALPLTGTRSPLLRRLFLRRSCLSVRNAVYSAFIMAVPLASDRDKPCRVPEKRTGLFLSFSRSAPLPHAPFLPKPFTSVSDSSPLLKNVSLVRLRPRGSPDPFLSRAPWVGAGVCALIWLAFQWKKDA